MPDVIVLILLYAVGVLILVGEIFIPSHGVLSVAGIGFLVAAVVKTFGYAGREAGIMAVVACAVLLPTFAVLAIKYWHRTPVGRRIAPPNPTFTLSDTPVPIEELSKLIGRTGRSATALRPVGICEFGGRRISCVAELGIIEEDVAVEAVGIRSGNLAVQEQKA